MTALPNDSDKRARLAQVGELLYGDRYVRRLASEMGLSQPFLSRVVSGGRKITPDVEEKLADVIHRERRRLIKTLRTILLVEANIRAELGQHAMPHDDPDADIREGRIEATEHAVAVLDQHIRELMREGGHEKEIEALDEARRRIMRGGPVKEGKAK